MVLHTEVPTMGSDYVDFLIEWEAVRISDQRQEAEWAYDQAHIIDTAFQFMHCHTMPYDSRNSDAAQHAEIAASRSLCRTLPNQKVITQRSKEDRAKPQ